MKITHLILTSTFAGSERHVVELANAQANDSHEVSVILSTAGCQDRPDAIAHRINPAVTIIPVRRFLPIAYLQVRRWLTQNPPDIIHAHLSQACRIARYLPQSLRPRVATLHIHYKPQQHSSFDGLVAITPSQLNDLPEPLRSRSIHINNWTSATPSPRSAGLALRQTFCIPHHHKVLGSLGRIENSKGTELLIQAFLQANLPDTSLVLVGQGPDLQRLRKQYAAQTNIILPGFSNSPQDWLAGFDLFISAALSEPFGLVFLEAMTANLPILATQTNGAQHLGQQFPFPLEPTNNIPALANAITQASQSLPISTTYDLSPYQLPHILPKITGFYQSLCANPS